MSWDLVKRVINPRNSFKKAEEYQPKSTILQSYYPLAICGHICGFFPMEKVLDKFEGVGEIKFRFLSWPFLYCLVINFILYFFSAEMTYTFWYKGRNYFKFATDIFAVQFFLAVYILIRVLLHLCTIIRSPRILNCLNLIQMYDNKFSHVNKSTLSNKYTLWYLIGTILNNVGNISASYTEALKYIREDYYKSRRYGTRPVIPLIIFPSPLFVGIFGFFVHTVAELALFMAQVTISFTVNCICHRILTLITEIDDMRTKIESREDTDPGSTKEHKEINEDRNGKIFYLNGNNSNTESSWKECFNINAKDDTRNVPFPNTNYNAFVEKDNVTTINESEEIDHNGTEALNEDKIAKQISMISRKYLFLLNICHELDGFAKEVILIFTAGSTIILTSLCYLIVILLTQYVPASSNRVYQFSEIVPMIFIACFSMMRLLNFVNTGEKLLRNGFKLNIAVNQFGSINKDTARLVGHLQHLIYSSRSRLSLAGCQFFILKRSVITAILGPVITFIVILVQFRATDFQLYANGSNSTFPKVNL